MRDIKFRAWDKVAKKWVSGASNKHFCVDNGVVVLVEYHPHPRGTWEPKTPRQLTWDEIKNLEIMQYTGLKDRHGNPIYEGDIVRDEDGYRFKIEWSSARAGWMMIAIDIILGTVMSKSDSEENIEVIGNIYENPGLLA